MVSKSQFKNSPFGSWVKKLNIKGKKARNNGKHSEAQDHEEAPSEEALKPAENGSAAHKNENGVVPNTPPIIPEHQVDGSSLNSLHENRDGQGATENSTKSATPTVATNADTMQSKSGTTNTPGGGMSSHSGGGGSIFSASNHSSHSLATTLTTMQSTAPSGQINQAGGTPNAGGPHGNHAPQHSQGSIYFSHLPNNAANSTPSHLQPGSQSHVPTTYRSATANGLLTDNASIITLASSSHNIHNHNRNSLDEDASIRAIAPTSHYGSRESLPLSTLSQTNDSLPPGTIPPLGAGGQQSQQRPSIGGLANAERTSVYSSQGVTAPALSSERNSIYTGKSGNQGVDGNSMRATDGSSLRATDGSSVRGQTGDGGSMRSGLAGHGRSDSVAGSIGAVGSSPWTSPREPQAQD
ncbi:MAG: hypothetical protein M1831_003400 [Alyxoria varia]|nr:MAG: hypothetical protein M1831_003400 [Alyxoria varia]